MLLKASVIEATADLVNVQVKVNGSFETDLALDQNTPGFRNISKDQEVVKGDKLNLNVKFHPGRPVGEQLEIICVSRPVSQTALMG